jgi:hypothetical protein
MEKAMRLKVGLLAAAVGLGVAGAAAAAPSIEIRDAVARVVVIPEDRADVKVEMLTTNRDLPLEVRQTSDGVTIDGHLWHRIRDCHANGDHPSTSVRGVGRVDYKDMPQVVIHTPKAVSLESNGAIVGSVGRSASLEIHNSGCSAWTIADVAGDATLQDSGVGAIRMGQAQRLDVHLSGVTNVHVNRVSGLDASLSGTGGLTLNELNGPMEARVSGAGHIKVLQGNASAMRASISGVGGIEFGGQAQTLDAQISGIGGIRVKSVTGSVTKSVSGLGHVTIG